MTIIAGAPHTGDEDAPEQFARALADVRSLRPRPEVSLEEMPAPRRLAPHAAAFAVTLDDGRELATGRLVILHDPQGQEGWAGTLRLVTYLRAELEAEIAADPLLVRVGWSWLTEALATHEASYDASAGTVTRSASESFGSIADRPPSTEMELRASWTVCDGEAGRHVLAWCDALCTAAGLPTAPPGVTPLHHGYPT